MTWEEVEKTLQKKDASLLVFEAKQVVARVEKLGDLFEPMLELKQTLPDLRKTATAQPERIDIAAQADEEHEHPQKKTGAKKPDGRKPPVRKTRKI